ncbi:MAG: TonB-dependent receptor, partial [Bacteroidota bacterium]
TRPDSKFFVFADTVAAINYHRTIKGNGWLGIRFQLESDSEPNDFVLHCKMLDNDNQLQQSAIGILGVNMLYACYNYYDDPDMFIKSLLDNLHGRVKVDMVRVSGPDFNHLDNRYASLLLVKHGLSDVAMFDENGASIHGSEFLYKKSLMVVRGNYRPPTLVSLDVIKSSFEQFKSELDVDTNRAHVMAELTLDNLKINGEIDQKDFLDRADLLCALGQQVIISDCNNHQALINYLSDFKIRKLGLVIGVHELLDIINDKYYKNQDGRLLVAFGELFTRNIKIYAYPVLQENSNELLTASTLPVPDGIKFLHQYLMENQHIEEVVNYNEDLLHIFPWKVLELIQRGDEQWERMVPTKLVELIKHKEMFGYPTNKLEFEV